MFHDDCVLNLPDDVLPCAPAAPVSRRKRKRGGLPQNFWLVGRDASHVGPIAVHATIAVDLVVRLCDFHQQGEHFDADQAHDLERQAQTVFATRRLNRHDAVRNALCWHVADVTPIQPPVELSAAALPQRWHSVLKMPSTCDSVVELHRQQQVVMGTRFAWVVPSAKLADILGGRCSWLASSDRHAIICGVERPDLVENRLVPDKAWVPKQAPILHHKIKRGFATKRYSVPALMDALQLSWAIRNLMSTSVAEVVKLAWRCSLPPEQYLRLEQDMQQGLLTIPQRSVLSLATVKLDIMMTVYQRKLLLTHHSDRYLLADASELKGTNFFIMREDSFMHPSDSNIESKLQSDLQGAYTSRHLPLSTLGLGASAEMHKGANLCHAMVLESGSTQALFQKRRETRALCSDQGVESKLIDCGFALSPNANLEDWQSLLQSVRPGDLSAAGDSYLLPKAIFIPDCLHILFGALEHSVTTTENWSHMNKVLKCLSRFLSRTSRRERFAQSCLASGDDKRALQRYIGDITDWKWEYTSMFLLKVRDIVPLLVMHFDAARYIKGPDGCEALAKGEAAIATELEESLRTPHLIGKCEVLRCTCFALDRFATRLEGCRCHERVLEDRSSSWTARVAKYREASKGCYNKGRRAVELALGYADEMVAALRSASDNMLRSTYASMEPCDRQAMQSLELKVKASLCHRITLKFSNWTNLPYKIIGVYGCIVGLCSVDKDCYRYDSGNATTMRTRQMPMLWEGPTVMTTTM